MPSLWNKNTVEERLTVVIGTTQQLKLLGVPSYIPGTDRKRGQIIADLTTELVVQSCTIQYYKLYQTLRGTFSFKSWYIKTFPYVFYCFIFQFLRGPHS